MPAFAQRHHAASTIGDIADGVYTALMEDDIPQAMHLSWILMSQSQCPLHLQARAVLIHSAASLTLGGDPEAIETNLQAMIRRVGSALSRLSMHSEEAARISKTLVQLRTASSALRHSRRTKTFSSSSSSSTRSRESGYQSRRQPVGFGLRELESIMEGFGKMDLGCVKGGLMDHAHGPSEIPHTHTHARSVGSWHA